MESLAFPHPFPDALEQVTKCFPAPLRCVFVCAKPLTVSPAFSAETIFTASDRRLSADFPAFGQVCDNEQELNTLAGSRGRAPGRQFSRSACAQTTLDTFSSEIYSNPKFQAAKLFSPFDEPK